jgi:hypothetical protein
MGCAISAQQKLIPEIPWHDDRVLGKFIADLSYAAQNRDADFVLAVLSENVISSVSESDFGKEQFILNWDIRNRTSKFWSCLEKILKMGGTFFDDAHIDVVFPYAYRLDLKKDDVDFLDILVITGSQVNVRASPAVDAENPGQLTHEVVMADWGKSVLRDDETETECDPYIWYFVHTFDNRLAGYVHSDFVYSPLMPRMFLAKEGDEWKITAFVAGD